MATNGMQVCLNNETKYIYSTSGSQSSIVKYNKGLQDLKLNLVYFTFPDPITPEIYVGCLRAPFCRGGAVTAHNGLKTTIIPYLDVVEPLALTTKAVNTVVNINGKLHGYNTDVYGLSRALMTGLKKLNLLLEDDDEDNNNSNNNNRGVSSKIKTAVIYGNGGVSGVAWHVLTEILHPFDGKVTIIGRDPQRVLTKRKELEIDHIPHFDGPYDLVVDATPIASQPNLPEEFRKIVKEAKVVFCHSMPEEDNKPNSVKQFCQQHGIAYIPGSSMHAAQMVKQYSLYFAQEKDKINISEEDISKTWNLELP